MTLFKHHVTRNLSKPRSGDKGDKDQVINTIPKRYLGWAFVAYPMNVATLSNPYVLNRLDFTNKNPFLALITSANKSSPFLMKVYFSFNYAN